VAGSVYREGMTFEIKRKWQKTLQLKLLSNEGEMPRQKYVGWRDAV
jgi:hypothetical protein